MKIDKNISVNYPILFKLFFTIFTLLLISILFTSSLFAENFRTGLASLQITPNARECAMAGTGVVSAIGPSAMYYNPSLTGNLNSFAININYTKWFLDTYEQSLFLVKPLHFLNLGLGVVNFNAGKFDFRPDYPTDEPTGYYKPNDFNFYLNLSRTITKNSYSTSFGISGRYYYEKIYEYDATGIGADAGFAVKFPANVQIGFSIINFGTTMKFIREDFWLPTRLLGGVSYNVDFSNTELKPKVKITSDLGYLMYDDKFEFNSGIELSMKDKYFLRTGYKFIDKTNHLNFGFGLIVKNLRIEYAFSPYSLNLNTTHHFSLSLGY
jgi:hypothetical protein